MTLTKLERMCIDAHRRGNRVDAAFSTTGDETQWLRFGLSVLLEVGRMVRGVRLLPTQDALRFKPDGSPVTPLEHRIESFVHERLTAFHPEAGFVGEEHGGTLPRRGFAAALDPVDGTWSLVNRSETCATGLAFFHDGEAFLGMVLNPVTGELAYATRDAGTRLLQLSLFGEVDAAFPLPVDRIAPHALLVNLQPSRNAGSVVGHLFDAWRERGLNMVKLAGGSPLWAMLEAAKGNFVYVNLWARRSANPYDLAAGILLLRGAGGDVTDFDGEPIKTTDHIGAFVAGIDRESRLKVASIARSAL